MTVLPARIQCCCSVVLTSLVLAAATATAVEDEVTVTLDFLGMVVLQ